MNLVDPRNRNEVVSYSGFSNNTDSQQLSLSNDTLSIDNGNSISMIKYSNTNPFYPDGIDGLPIILTANSYYNVPNGKTLYLTNVSSCGGCNNYLISNNDTFYSSTTTLIKQNTNIISNYIQYGFLINKGVDIVNWHTANSYTVPQGKTLYLISYSGGTLVVNSVVNDQLWGGNTKFLIFGSGTVLSFIGTQGRKPIFTGYLK